MAVNDIKNLSQNSSMMFERNIAIMASKEELVKITTNGDDFCGFFCGLDEKWLQICGWSELQMNDDHSWDLILLNRGSTISVQSLGSNSNDLDQTVIEQVKKKIYNFSTVSKTFLEKKK